MPTTMPKHRGANKQALEYDDGGDGVSESMEKDPKKPKLLPLSSSPLPLPPPLTPPSQNSLKVKDIRKWELLPEVVYELLWLIKKSEKPDLDDGPDAQQDIDQQNDIPTSSHSIDEDEVFESCNNLALNDSKCIINKNDLDNTKCSNMNGKNILETLRTINKTSIVNHSTNNLDNKLIKVNNSLKLSQMSQTENKCFIAICGSINANINSQEEKIILNMVQKNIKHILPPSAELIDMNTQHFMDLNLNRAIHNLHGSQQLEDISEKRSVELMESDDSVYFTLSSFTSISDTFTNSKHNIKNDNYHNLHGSQQLEDISKKRSVELMESDDSVYFTLSSFKSISDTSTNSKHNIKNVITDTELKKLGELNNSFSKNYNELPNQMDNELMNQDEDSEIINFRAMCEAMPKIGTIDKQVNLNGSRTMIQNQMENIVLKEVSGDVLIVKDNVKCVPITNQLISSVDSDGSNLTGDIYKRKRHHCYSPPLDLFGDSSPEYFSEISQKKFNHQNKKTKFTLQNSSNIQSKSSSKKVGNQSNKNTMNFITLTSSEDEDCMLIKSQSPKVNGTKRSYERKSINTNSSKQNTILLEKEHIFYCSPHGLIHRDMMKYLRQNDILKNNH